MWRFLVRVEIGKLFPPRSDGLEIPHRREVFASDVTQGKRQTLEVRPVWRLGHLKLHPLAAHWSSRINTDTTCDIILS
jgi:hypothetical protein